MAAFPMAPGRSDAPAHRATTAASGQASTTQASSQAAQPALDEFNSDLGAARVTIEHLGRWARRYVLLSKTEADGGCLADEHHCVLADSPGGADACRLARDLAWMAADNGVEAQPRLGLDWEAVAQRYLQALGDAANAVAYCQAVQHHIGACWFDPTGRGDLCTRTADLAQRLRTR